MKEENLYLLRQDLNFGSPYRNIWAKIAEENWEAKVERPCQSDWKARFKGLVTSRAYMVKLIGN